MYAYTFLADFLEVWNMYLFSMKKKIRGTVKAVEKCISKHMNLCGIFALVKSHRTEDAGSRRSSIPPGYGVFTYSV